MAINPDGSQTYFPLSQEAFNECLAMVQQAQAQWLAVVSEFAAENVAMGITASGKTALIGSTLANVAVYGGEGSLWEAYNALGQIVCTPQMAPFLTEDRIKWMMNKMIQIIGKL
jgi:hypothetical protein